MEWRIGEIFEYNGEWYQCVKGDICADCAFVKKHCNENPLFEAIGSCSKYYREDATSVIFKKLEKVGEPYEYYVSKKGIINVQDYLLADPNHTIYNKIEGVYDYLDDKVVIEIKQKQEDMEEKTQLPKEDNPLTRLVYNYVNGKNSDKDLIESIKELPDKYPYTQNLKEFDLEAAKAGKSVCTRDGRKARIICFDRRFFYKNVSYPILALVECSDGEDDVCGYTEKGKVLIKEGAEHKDDLMMLPEKKEGWINVYKGLTQSFASVYPRIYKSKEEAINDKPAERRIDTIKIEWEE